MDSSDHSPDTNLQKDKIPPCIQDHHQFQKLILLLGMIIIQKRFWPKAYPAIASSKLCTLFFLQKSAAIILQDRIQGAYAVPAYFVLCSEYPIGNGLLKVKVFGPMVMLAEIPSQKQEIAQRKMLTLKQRRTKHLDLSCDCGTFYGGYISFADSPTILKILSSSSSLSFFLTKMYAIWLPSTPSLILADCLKDKKSISASLSVYCGD